VQGYVNQQMDFTAVVLAIKQSGADVLASYVTFPTDLAVLARQLRQLGVTTPWIGSQAMTTSTARELAGQSLFGTYSVVDFSADANPEAAAYVKAYEEAYKILADVYAARGSDQITVIAAALKAAGSTGPEAVRTALPGIRGLKGANGAYNFDANGDGLRNLKVVRNDGGKLAFVRQVDFDD
jgi:branched-chain amino acid transport system substrate-binding protein